MIVSDVKGPVDIVQNKEVRKIKVAEYLQKVPHN